MGPGDLAPDHADLRSPDLLLSPVDVGDLLAEVEAAKQYQYAGSGTDHREETYLAALVSSTPSIFTRLVPE